MRVPKFGSDSAKTAGPPDADDGTQYVGGTGSVGWSVQAGEEWRLVATALAVGFGRNVAEDCSRNAHCAWHAGENLQRVSVQIRRPRWWCFLWGEIPLTLSRKLTRFLQA